MTNFPPSPYGTPSGTPSGTVTEKVGLGLAFAVLAVIGGMVVAVILWRIGFVAGISSFVIAAGAVFLYTQGAGTAPRTGLIPLIVLIVVGVVLSFFAVVASDLWDVYEFVGGGQSRVGFILDNLTNSDYAANAYESRNFVFFLLFAVLGVFSTMRRVLAAR